MNKLMFLVCLVLVGCGKSSEVVHVKGPAGSSCFTEQRIEGNFIICGGSEFQVKDGSFEGQVELVEVCPNIKGRHNETLLLLDGRFLAFLASSSYKNERLVTLNENTLYQTTDGRKILFKVSGSKISYGTKGCE